MGRNLDDVIKNLPADRQAKIAALSRKKVAEMIAHAVTLADVRKALGETQTELAEKLGIGQNSISQLEKRTDTYVSTLRRVLQSLGMTLELAIVDKDGVRIELPHFLRLQEERPGDDGGAAPSSAAKPRTRKTAAKAVVSGKLGTASRPAPGNSRKAAVTAAKHAGGLQKR